MELSATAVTLASPDSAGYPVAGFRMWWRTPKRTRISISPLGPRATRPHFDFAARQRAESADCCVPLGPRATRPHFDFAARSASSLLIAAFPGESGDRSPHSNKNADPRWVGELLCRGR
jgi:hypothetical protein